MTNLIISGGRDRFISYAGFMLLDQLLLKLELKVTLFNGGATGVDASAWGWGEYRGLAMRKYNADWTKYGKRAGPIRNAQMVDDAGKDGILIAFMGGVGTTNIVNYARNKITIYDFRSTKGYVV